MSICDSVSLELFEEQNSLQAVILNTYKYDMKKQKKNRERQIFRRK